VAPSTTIAFSWKMDPLFAHRTATWCAASREKAAWLTLAPL
jgi:hypothetical protein